MASGKKKVQSGSAQVGEWKFTYQDRIHLFEGVESGQGFVALSAYGELHGRLERRLFGHHCAGVSLSSLKNSFLVKYQISARMFNSLRVSLEGKISSVRESQARRIESLKGQISTAKKQVAGAVKRENHFVVHQKKRRLENFNQRLACLVDDVKAKRVRICFGSKKLWHKQYALVLQRRV